MSAAIMEGQLLRVLNGAPTLRQRGCRGQLVPAGGVAVVHRGRRLGLWQWQSGRFHFAPADSSAPGTEVATPAEALLYTERSICPR